MINLLTGAINATVVSTTLLVGGLDYKEYVTERECLALNIYHEARGEPVVGQEAVAYVTINRMYHEYFPETICDVVYEQFQFSWTSDGLSDRVTETEAYHVALEIASDVIGRRLEDPTQGALFYHADYVNPNWADAVDFEVKIGNHLFYTWDGTWS